MEWTTCALVEHTHATIGYVQSDEISLVWIPTENGHGWFDGKTMKMTSVLAGLATSAFIQGMFHRFDDADKRLQQLPHFDARVISMPSETEAANMLLWRNLDATKNAISMAASHYYSHRELHGKSSSDKQEMLFQKGVNFNNYPEFFRRGTWVKRFVEERALTSEEWIRIPEKHRPDPDASLVRSTVRGFDLPPLSKITNRVEVLFRGVDPVTFEVQYMSGRPIDSNQAILGS
jgi:tRNA(His) 5'-end guanylyltransferase